MVILVTGSSLNVAFAVEPGQQMCTAHWTEPPPVIDGVIDPDEYRAATPLYVTLDQPTTPPGITIFQDRPEAPWFPPPDDPADLSFTIYALYDDRNLYIAVDVMDDIVLDDGPQHPGGFEISIYDDVVEIRIDGDQVGNDVQMGRQGGSEAFTLGMDVGGDAMTVMRNDFHPYAMHFWEGAPGLRPGGYVIEFKISLVSIDTQDGAGEDYPGPGSSIGFNVGVEDDDNGGFPYNLLDVPPSDPDAFVESNFQEPATDNFATWDGNSADWDYKREDDWGTLYFAPRGTVSVSPTTWGQVKDLLR
jgi:hypothetical protein